MRIVFGAKKMYVTEKFIQLQTPGSQDIIVLDKSNGEFKKTAGLKLISLN